MRLTHPLDEVFPTASHVRILRALDELPDGVPVSARELARRSGLSHPTASSVLASLGRQGIVIARRGPRADAFELNRRHILVEKLQPLFDWERLLFGEFLSFIVRAIGRTPGVSGAYLFGSVVRGEMTSTSDIDLAMVVPDPSWITETESALDRVADAVRERFGNRLNVTIGSSSIEQLRRHPRPGHRLWERIAQEGIAVIDRDRSPEKGRSDRGVPKEAKTVTASRGEASLYLAKGEQFLEEAQQALKSSRHDAAMLKSIHAATSAADAVTVAHSGRRSIDRDHQRVADLLEEVGRRSESVTSRVKHLRRSGQKEPGRIRVASSKCR